MAPIFSSDNLGWEQAESAWEDDENKGRPYYNMEDIKYMKNPVFEIKSLKSYKDVPLFKAFYPFFISMKLFGLFHDKEYVVDRKIRRKCFLERIKHGFNTTEEVEGHVPLKKRITPSSVYCFMVKIILWLNVFRHMSSIDLSRGFDGVLLSSVIALIFFILVACGATTCFLACHKYTNIPQFFYEWGKMHLEYPGKWSRFFDGVSFLSLKPRKSLSID